MKNKGYEKALSLFNQGNIEKAIEICEREISRDLTNSNVINLKGLLLYLKGNLEDSIALWNINKNYNYDSISSSYIKDIQNDFKRKELYEEAKELINKLEIDKAIDILNLCSESDFNSINVNNDLAFCYYKKGDYEKVRECLEKVFSLDKYNSIAKEINEELNSTYRCNNKRTVRNKIFWGAIIALGIIIIIFIGKEKFINYQLEKIDLVQNLESSEKSEENQYIVNNEINDTVEKESITKRELTDDEIRENYIMATELYDEGNYEKVIETLEETISNLKGSHLDDDIIFLLGATYEMLENRDKAIEFFDKYINEYANGSYIEEVYYRAALLYKDKDINISKNYANKILINYPDSIYNNSYVEEIMSS